jgi:hypothetical protein
VSKLCSTSLQLLLAPRAQVAVRPTMHTLTYWMPGTAAQSARHDLKKCHTHHTTQTVSHNPHCKHRCNMQRHTPGSTDTLKCHRPRFAPCIHTRTDGGGGRRFDPHDGGMAAEVSEAQSCHSIPGSLMQQPSDETRCAKLGNMSRVFRRQHPN